MTKFELLIVAGIILLVIGFSLAYGSNETKTNATASMLFSDNWDCGYINTTITLEQLRDCFRD